MMFFLSNDSTPKAQATGHEVTLDATILPVTVCHCVVIRLYCRVCDGGEDRLHSEGTIGFACPVIIQNSIPDTKVIGGSSVVITPRFPSIRLRIPSMSAHLV